MTKIRKLSEVTSRLYILIKAALLKGCFYFMHQLLNFKIRTRLFSLLVIFVVASVIMPFSPLVSSAAAAPATDTLENRSKSFSFLNALRHCVAYSRANLDTNTGAQVDRISEDAVKSGKWFGDDQYSKASYLSGSATEEGGDTLCNKVVSDASSLWGYGSPLELYCSFMPNDRVNKSSCLSGSGPFLGAYGSTPFPSMDPSNALDKSIKNKIYNGNSPAVNAELLYLIYESAFFGGCNPKDSVSPADAYAYHVTLINADGTQNPKTYEGVKFDTNRYTYTGSDLTELSESCRTIESRINEYSPAYAKYRKMHSGELITTGPEKALCERDPTRSECATTDAKSSCAIDGVGWIVCPVLTAGASLSDAAYGFLSENFLKVEVGLLGKDTQAGWKVMQGIANVLFIVVFLWMIYLLLTSSGSSNRLAEFRKVFLRLIVMVILANLSFYICQILVDLSNVAGFSLKSLLGGVASQVQTTAENTVRGNDSTNIAGIVTVVIAAGAAAWLNIGAILVALIGAIVSLLVIFFMLAMRKALIVLLIVIAPIAFVAYTLPNTQGLFDKWRKMFTGLLLVFPVIGLVYGACLLAHAILWNVAQGSGDSKQIMEIIAYMALVIPLIVTIPLLKSSLSAAGNIGGTLNNLRGKLSGAANKSAEQSRLGQFKRYQKGQQARRKALIQSGQYRGSNYNPVNWIRNSRSLANRGINSVTGQFGEHSTAEGVAIANKAEAESVGAQEQLIRRNSTKDPAAAQKALEHAIQTGDTTAAKAAQNILFTQGAAGMRSFHETVSKAESNGTMNKNAGTALRENINANHGQMVKTKAADVSKWAAVGGSLESHTKSRDTWAGMSQADLAGQTGDSLQRAVNNGHIDGSVASELLRNAQLSGNLDAKQTAALNQAAGGSAPRKVGPIGNDPTGNDPGNLNIPRS